MKIAVIGTGYVGLVAGACFAEMGNDVVCVDRDEGKIEQLGRGECPIFEPGLAEMLPAHIATDRLAFTTSIGEAADHADVFFLAVGTESAADGAADLSAVLAVARVLGESIQRPALIVAKSTVPVGTGERIEATVREALAERDVDLQFEVVSNPEFLQEGAAVRDFMRPDRIIVGTDSEWAREVMHELYRAFSHQRDRILFMGRRDAELTKYAANAMLATRISFMNEVAGIAERLDVDVENVRLGIGSDPRIGYSFLYPGAGFGGSCLPKDVKALIHSAREYDFEPAMLEAVEKRNECQKHRINERIREHFGDELSGRTFGLWGLAFKPGTDDMREAPSKVVLEYLIGRGAKVLAHDPEAMEVARRELPDEWFEKGSLTLVSNPYDACRDVDALVLVTEWKPFRHPDFVAMRDMMKGNVIFDGRNQYDPRQLKRHGFRYVGIGRRN